MLHTNYKRIYLGTLQNYQLFYKITCNIRYVRASVRVYNEI